MKFANIRVAVVAMCLIFAVAAQAQEAANQNAAAAPASSQTIVPRLIKFSGTLLDAQDRPMAGPVGVTFALHAQQSGGAALWMETQNVEPDARGNYTILLGANSAKGVPAELFVSGEARWLEVQVERQAAHERILLVSVPYALKAGDAQTLGGKPASAYLTSETLTSAGTSAAATATPGAPLKSSAATTGKKAASTPQFAACSGLTSNGSATINSIGLFTTACNIQSSVITQSGSNVGIGTAAPAVALDIVGNNAGLRLSGTGTHQVTVTGASSGRLGQDVQGFFFASDTNGKVIKFLTNNGSLNEWMRITSAGNVGIGTTTPAAKLDVAGNLNLPVTTGATVGVISLGGTRFAHNFGTSNTFLGVNAGNFTMTGFQNTAHGGFALSSNTAGDSNTANGWFALTNNTTGSNNTASGSGALGNNTVGSNNTSNGEGALAANTSGNKNTASGESALQNNTNGSNNTADGWFALQGNTTGSNNAAVGFQAGLTANFSNANTTGSSNTFLGSNAGPGTPTQLTNATAIGANAAVTCSNCMVLGGTGASAVNVGIGTMTPAAKLDINGNLNLPSTTSATMGVISLGSPFLHNFGPAGAFNTFLGLNAGNFTMTGNANTASGTNALSSNTTGSSNTASGLDALQNNTTGGSNTATGVTALQNNTTGNNNTASGAAALQSNISGHDNTASGGDALFSNTIGTVNTAVGELALSSNTSGSGNTVIGYQAGVTSTFANANTTGSNNTFIGFRAGPGTATQLTNATAIGANALVSESNALVLGGTGANAVMVGIGTATPDNNLTVSGTADKTGGGSWGTFSDGRLKNVFGSFHSGLKQVLQLNPIRYQYKEENPLGIHDTEKHIGLVAQEVQRVIPEAVSADDKGYLLVNNDPILWSMLNAIKEQQREIRRLTREIRELRKTQKATERPDSLQKLAPTKLPGGRSRDRDSARDASRSQ